MTPAASAPPGDRPPRVTGALLRRFLADSVREVSIYDRENRWRYFNAASLAYIGQPWEVLRGVRGPGKPGVLEERFGEPRAAGRYTTWVTAADGASHETEYAFAHGVVRGERVGIAMTREVTGKRFFQREADALIRIALQSGVERPLRDTFDQLAHTVVEATDAVASMIGVMEDDPPRILGAGASFAVRDDYWRNTEAIWRSGTASPVVTAYRERRPVITRRSRDAYLSDPDREPVKEDLEAFERWDASVNMPLIYRDRILGVLVANFPEGREPDDDVVAFLRAIADQAAVVVANARLFEDVQAGAALAERQRLARELHDSVSQSLYGIGLGARTARALVEDNPEAAAVPLEYILELTDAGLAEMRALVFELRPDSLAREGLAAAIEKQAAALSARNGLRIDLDAAGEPDLGIAVKEAIYRVVMEALHNVVKHAGASRVRVTLRASSTAITAEVTDDGHGFDPTADFPGHMGLVSMRQRMAAFGGGLEIDSAEGRGTTVRARIGSGK